MEKIMKLIDYLLLIAAIATIISGFFFDKEVVGACFITFLLLAAARIFQYVIENKIF